MCLISTDIRGWGASMLSPGAEARWREETCSGPDLTQMHTDEVICLLRAVVRNQCSNSCIAKSCVWIELTAMVSIIFCVIVHSIISTFKTCIWNVICMQLSFVVLRFGGANSSPFHKEQHNAVFPYDQLVIVRTWDESMSSSQCLVLLTVHTRYENTWVSS